MGQKPSPPGGDQAGASEAQLEAARRGATLAEQLSQADDDAWMDEHRLELARRDQDAVIEQFVREHARWLRSLAARLVGRAHCDDVAQDACESLVMWIRTNPQPRVTELLGAPEQLKKLMCTITARRAYDHLRRQLRRKDDLTDDGAEITPEAADPSMPPPHVSIDFLRLAHAYAALPPMQRIAHILHYYYELAHAEIAAILEISLTNCQTLVYRANHALKAAMEMNQ